jgi:hypothetical protein
MHITSLHALLINNDDDNNKNNTSKRQGSLCKLIRLKNKSTTTKNKK